jgi:hypothetical protein
VGKFLRRADDGGGLRAAAHGAHPTESGFPLTPHNIWGWIFFEGVYVGPTEEIPFRALLVTYYAFALGVFMPTGWKNRRAS